MPIVAKSLTPSPVSISQSAIRSSRADQMCASLHLPGQGSNGDRGESAREGLLDHEFSWRGIGAFG